MAFIETRFDDKIAYGSTAIPSYSTRVKTSAAGYESRNENWSETRLMFDLSTGIKTREDLDHLIEFFHAVKGRAIGFRFKDWSDFTSKGAYDIPAFDDQVIFGPAIGGETGPFQLIKTYVAGSTSTIRTIRKPVNGTVLMGAGPTGSPVLIDPANYSVDYTTGEVTLTNPLIAGDYVTSGFEFDEAVRFNSDSISVVLDAYKVGNASVDVIQVRED